MVKKRETAPPTSPGTAVLVMAPSGPPRPGVIIDTMSGRYLVRFPTREELWVRPEEIRSNTGRTEYRVRAPSDAEIEHAKRGWTPTLRHSQVVEIDPSARSEHPTHLDITPPERVDRAPPNPQSVGTRERRSAGRYSYTRGSEPPPAHDEVSVRGLQAALKNKKKSGEDA